MSFARRLRLPLGLTAVLLISACGDPPDKELQQARSAIESARGAGAEVYARDEFSAAETALKGATEAVDQRDYRLALNRALDARERAQNATRSLLPTAGGRSMAVLDWLLDSDPAIRWQVLRDLVHAPAEVVAAERARVATEGWGARLLALHPTSSSVPRFGLVLYYTSSLRKSGFNGLDRRHSKYLRYT